MNYAVLFVGAVADLVALRRRIVGIVVAVVVASGQDCLLAFVAAAAVFVEPAVPVAVGLAAQRHEGL